MSDMVENLEDCFSGFTGHICVTLLVFRVYTIVQHKLCYTTTGLNRKFKASNHLIWLYRPLFDRTWLETIKTGFIMIYLKHVLYEL